MTIIDSQVHAYEPNTPKRPWHSVPNWPDHVTGGEMVAAMDKVGVDGAIFISAFSMYRYDASYAVEVQRAHPGRIAIVKPLDPDNPDVADVVADWKKTPGAVSIRIMLTKEAARAPDDPGLDRIARAAPRVRRRHLRAGGRAVPQDGAAERERAGHADGRRVRQGLWLGAEQGLAAPNQKYRKQPHAKVPAARRWAKPPGRANARPMTGS